MYVLLSEAMVPPAQVVCGEIIAPGGTCLVTADLRLFNQGLVCYLNQIRLPVSKAGCRNAIQRVVVDWKIRLIRLPSINAGENCKRVLIKLIEEKCQIVRKSEEKI